MKILSIAMASLAMSAALGQAGCSTAPSTEGGKQAQTIEVNEALNIFHRQDPSLAARIERAYGYAVFPHVGKGGAGIGGAYGRGQVYDHNQMIGYCDLSQGSIGAQLGGQKYSELILFENKGALDRFKSGEFAVAAQASAVAASSGAAANAKYNDGVMIFVAGEKGLMAEASVGGQKFTFQPI